MVRSDARAARRRPLPSFRSAVTGRRPRTRLAVALAAVLGGALLNVPAAQAGARQPAGPPPAAAACPASLTDKATCYTGQDVNGAHYAIAVPKKWNGSLVVHAHGGPDLGAGSDPARSVDDLDRWSVMVDRGYAWAGSSYRRGGYGTRMAAEDTENVRKLFVAEFGRPKRTFVHGQSWGGNVAAKVVEEYADRPGRYDGALLTNGVLGGGSRGYDYRVDLRVVYQYYCQNLPRPTEPAYPLWQGLRPGSTLTSAGLRSRLQECTGYTSPAAERTALQQRNLDDILAVTGIPERTLESHLRFSVFTFRDIVHERLGDRNPFDNARVRYTGSHDDRALNAGVERFSADPEARRDLSWDSDLTGEVDIPVLTLHAIDDPTAFVEHESAYRATLRGAGNGRDLVQTFTRETEHSGLSTSEYAASIAALDTWVRTDRKPTPASVARACAAHDSTYGTGCFYDTEFTPGSYASRVNARPGGRSWPAMTAAQERRWSRIDGVGIAP
ncbi:alpha/beta hydrolase family protein [Streptomyces sp. NPDC086091]|uniref:alpha/beta hydrolase family protein n=1 Tax=Streptomyces sp. NPDC086091 TaxID=3365751 RepID=UPI00381E2D51